MVILAERTGRGHPMKILGPATIALVCGEDYRSTGSGHDRARCLGALAVFWPDPLFDRG